MENFWWYKKDLIAGMSRPGLNHVDWKRMEFEDAVTLGWLGMFSCGKQNLDNFKKHSDTYAPKLFEVFNQDHRSAKKALEVFENHESVKSAFFRMAERTSLFESLAFEGNEIHFKYDQKSVERDINYLKQVGISRIVTLTEHHHLKNQAGHEFTLHHIAIEDMGAPHLDQVHELAQIITETRSRGEKMAVHCLAGIGRTSTMLMGAHVLLGESVEDVKTHITKANPRFLLTGVQRRFIDGLAGGVS